MKIRYHIEPSARPPVITFTRDELISIETQARESGRDEIVEFIGVLIKALSEYS